MKVTIHNATTGEIIEREATKDEIAQAAKDQKLIDDYLEAADKRATQKAALLAKLGITQEEAALLLGGN
jgi:non-ribosomal peptide synthetase component E (peptide arylation enzyme)